DASIADFIQTAARVSGAANSSLRTNALGAFQADVALWEILARQGQIPAKALNASWKSALDPFAKVNSDIDLFEAARSSLRSTVAAAGGSSQLSQDEVVDLLAGPPQKSNAGRQVHDRIAERVSTVLDDQR